jgi:hypothetical protein
MSGEDAKAAEDFTDALDALWKVVKMGVFNVGAALDVVRPNVRHLLVVNPPPIRIEALSCLTILQRILRVRG